MGGDARKRGPDLPPARAGGLPAAPDGALRRIPLAILGGSDRKPAHLPRDGAELHPIADYKGAALKVQGRPLMAHLVERVSATEGFGPVTICGPARVYEPLGLGAEILDRDASVGANLRAAIEHHSTDGGPMAVLACDVLPSIRELTELRALYERDPCKLWLPFVARPEDRGQLGAFAWKPAYRMIQAGGEPVHILPGHLCVFEPGALRLPLLYRLMDAAYRTRNRSVGVRLTALLSRGLLGLLAIDAGLLVRLRAPTRTLTTVQSGLRLARTVRSDRVPLEELERIITRVFLRESARRSPAGACVRFPIVDFLSLAEDVDTEEEARALGAQDGGAG